MNSAGTEVADFERRRAPQAFFYRRAPLLDVFGGSVRIEGGEADGGLPKYSWPKIQRRLRLGGREQSRRGREVIELLRFGKNVRDIVALIAPGVEVDRSEEDSIRCVQDDSEMREIL